MPSRPLDPTPAENRRYPALRLDPRLLLRFKNETTSGSVRKLLRPRTTELRDQDWDLRGQPHIMLRKEGQGEVSDFCDFAYGCVCQREVSWQNGRMKIKYLIMASTLHTWKKGVGSDAAGRRPGHAGASSSDQSHLHSASQFSQSPHTLRLSLSSEKERGHRAKTNLPCPLLPCLCMNAP